MELWRLRRKELLRLQTELCLLTPADEWCLLHHEFLLLAAAGELLLASVEFCRLPRRLGRDARQPGGVPEKLSLSEPSVGGGRVCESQERVRGLPLQWRRASSAAGGLQQPETSGQPPAWHTNSQVDLRQDEIKYLKSYLSALQGGNISHLYKRKKICNRRLLHCFFSTYFPRRVKHMITSCHSEAQRPVQDCLSPTSASWV